MEHIKDSLSAYLDKELPEAENARVEAHLADCGECRGYLDELKSLSKLLSNLPQEALPAGFMARLERKRRAEAGTAEKPERDYWLLPFPARVAAFALSSMIVGLVVWDRFAVMFPSPRSMVSGAASSLDEGTAYKGAAERPAELARVAPAPKAERERKPLAKAPGAPFDGAKAVSGFAAVRGAGLGRRQEAAPAAAPAAEAAAPQGPTNEQILRDLESQKKRMQMKILPPEPRRFRMGRLAGAGGGNAALGDELQLLNQAPMPAMVPGEIPAILGERKAEVSPGAPVGEEAAAKEDGIGIPVAVVLRSTEDQYALWRKRGIKTEAPAVDYSREILLVLWSAASRVEISDVLTLPDRIVVRLRELPAAAETDSADKKAAEPVPTYQFRILPASDLPVVLQKLP